MGPALTSRSAPVAAARRLLRPAGRREAGRFLVEGPQAVREAAAAGQLLQLFATAEAAARHPELVAAAGPALQLADERAVAVLSDAVTPQGLIGVSPLLTRELAEPLLQEALAAGSEGGGGIVVVLVEPRDPGNLGTIVRTADAAGAAAVLLVGDAVDPHNGKVVRASVGSIFHLPLLTCAEWGTAAAGLRGCGLTLLAAAGDGATSLPSAEAAGTLTRPTAWIFGNEAHGLPRELAGGCDQSVSIPLAPAVESLNLATAVGICLFASVRAQRWQTPQS